MKKELQIFRNRVKSGETEVRNNKRILEEHEKIIKEIKLDLEIERVRKQQAIEEIHLLQNEIEANRMATAAKIEEERAISKELTSRLKELQDNQEIKTENQGRTQPIQDALMKKMNKIVESIQAHRQTQRIFPN